MEPHDKALNQAKILLLHTKNSTFIATILFSLKFSWDKSVPTATTNGLELRINPEWFMQSNTEQQAGLLAHEAWHVAFQHMIRKGARTLKRYNIAADHVINVMLINNRYQIPDGGYADLKYTGMSTEQVYDDIDPDVENQDMEGYGQDFDPAPNNDPVQQTKVQNQIKSTLIKAATHSKMKGEDFGHIPSDVQRALEDLLNPRLPWEVLLQNYADAIAKENYSWQKPNRRFMPDYYLPSQYSESIDEVAIAIDTSGSVQDFEFAAFMSEIEDIRVKLNPQKCTVIDFDTSIKNIHHLKTHEPVTVMNFHGYGGTNLTPVFKYFKNKPPNVLIVFSDLECEPWKEYPGYPVIWVIVNNPDMSANFGDIVHLDVKSS